MVASELHAGQSTCILFTSDSVLRAGMKNGICMNLNNFVRVSVGKGINLWLRDERLNRCLFPLRSLVYSPAVCSALRRLAVYMTLAIDYWTVTSNTLIAYTVYRPGRMGTSLHVPKVPRQLHIMRYDMRSRQLHEFVPDPWCMTPSLPVFHVIPAEFQLPQAAMVTVLLHAFRGLLINPLTSQAVFGILLSLICVTRPNQRSLLHPVRCPSWAVPFSFWLGRWLSFLTEDAPLPFVISAIHLTLPASSSRWASAIKVSAIM